MIFFISSTGHRLRRTPCPGPRTPLPWTPPPPDPPPPAGNGPRASKTPPNFHEKTPKKKRRENGSGRGKKKREILGHPSPPHPSSPHAAVPDPSGPHSSVRASGPPLFRGWPLRSSFFSCCLFFFCAFLIISVSCHFFLKISLFPFCFFCNCIFF